MEEAAFLVHTQTSVTKQNLLPKLCQKLGKRFLMYYELSKVVYYSLAVLTGSNRSFISCLGQSGKYLGSGRSLSQAHFSDNSGDSVPSSMEIMYFPNTGKNFQPWKLPHVAT